MALGHTSPAPPRQTASHKRSRRRNSAQVLRNRLAVPRAGHAGHAEAAPQCTSPHCTAAAARGARHACLPTSNACTASGGQHAGGSGFCCQILWPPQLTPGGTWLPVCAAAQVGGMDGSSNAMAPCCASGSCRSGGAHSAHNGGSCRIAAHDHPHGAARATLVCQPSTQQQQQQQQQQGDLPPSGCMPPSAVDPPGHRTAARTAAFGTVLRSKVRPTLVARVALCGSCPSSALACVHCVGCKGHCVLLQGPAWRCSLGGASPSLRGGPGQPPEQGVSFKACLQRTYTRACVRALRRALRGWLGATGTAWSGARQVACCALGRAALGSASYPGGDTHTYRHAHARVCVSAQQTVHQF